MPEFRLRPWISCYNMPELPEVETIRRELSPLLVGKQIAKVKVLWPKTVVPLTSKQFSTKLRGQQIVSVTRRAKILIIKLSGPWSLVFHLKMTGQLIYQPTIGGTDNLPNQFTRLVITFTDASQLFFNDLRKFGWARLVLDEHLALLTNPYGPEPLSAKFTAHFLQELFLRYPNRTVKQILMDQSLIAGLGNIYADEACFLAGVLPIRQAKTLNRPQTEKLHQAIVAVLKLSIKKKGTSTRNYVRSSGRPGGFVAHLKVYGQAKAPCKVCQTPIIKIKHLGRGTHYCPRCQQ
jgi:formamidopyrimidine-DNA glycosylase